MMGRILKPGEDYTGISVVYFCHDGQGNHLMQHRGPNCRDEQERWDIGAGAVDFDIGVITTLGMEIKQEYCTGILGYEFLGYRDVHRQHKGKPTHWLALDFKVLVDRKSVKNGEPHKFTEIGWFTLDTLPSPIHSQLLDFIRRYESRLCTQ